MTLAKYVTKITTFMTCMTFSLISAATHVNEDPLYQLTVPEIEIVGQFHGNPMDSDLNIFMAGNQFVVMDQLIEAFKAQYPKWSKIFYVTIPPGKELQWILNDGIELHAQNSLAPEGFKLTVLADVYTTVNKGHMDTLNNAGKVSEFFTYAHNRLVLMVDQNDPLAGATLTPPEFYNLMADPSVTISEPDILTQGIERHIWQMYTDTSKILFPNDAIIQALNGKMFDPNQLPNDPVNSLRRAVYYDKVLLDTTLLTSIHHLETPANIRNGNTRLGPVWVTEVLYQQNRLNNQDLVAIEIGGVGLDGKFLDRREKVNYLAAAIKHKKLKHSRKHSRSHRHQHKHKRAAHDWLTFLKSPTAQQLYQNAGFIPATDDELNLPFVY